MPDIFVKLAYYEKPQAISKVLNPLPDNLYWVRGMDFEPVLATHKAIEE